MSAMSAIEAEESYALIFEVMRGWMVIAEEARGWNSETLETRHGAVDELYLLPFCVSLLDLPLDMLVGTSHDYARSPGSAECHSRGCSSDMQLSCVTGQEIRMIRRLVRGGFVELATLKPHSAQPESFQISPRLKMESQSSLRPEAIAYCMCPRNPDDVRSI